MSGVYRTHCKPSDTPKTAIGSVSAAEPPSRCWIDYSDGAHSNGPSLETLTLCRSNVGISGVGSTPANVYWHIQTNRTGEWTARISLKYLDSEIAGIVSGTPPNEWPLRLSMSHAPSGSWAEPVDQSLNPGKNIVEAEVLHHSSDTWTDICLALIATGSSTPGEIHVYPGGPCTIQEAIDAVDPDGTVVVHPGVYRENIQFSGKDLVLQSTDPDDPAIRAATILDGATRGPVITFQGSETEVCIVEGLTIANGASANGAGIFGYGLGGLTHATIRKNVISSNMATGGGGGGIFACAGPIENNVISGNYAPSLGGGILLCLGSIEKNHIYDNVSGGLGGGLSDCFGPIQNNVIYRNQASSDGGGLSYCNAPIVNNTIWANEAGGLGGGMSHCESSYHPAWPLQGFDVSLAQTTIINNIVWENSAPAGAQISSCDAPTYCCIQDWTGGGTGNITGDPEMLFPEAGNPRLEPGSPCINAGASVSLTEDFEGESRPRNSLYDIGADEAYIDSLPARPANFQTSLDSDNVTVHLQWNANSPPPTGGYNVYRANFANGPFAAIATSITGTSYNDVADPGPRTIYTLTAGVDPGQSGRSDKKDETRYRLIVLDPGHGGEGTGIDSGGDDHQGGPIGEVFDSVWGGLNPPNYPREIVYERQLCWDLARRIYAILDYWRNTDRLEIYPTRAIGTSGGLMIDEYKALNARGMYAGEKKAKVFLSIHFNSVGDKTATQPYRMCFCPYEKTEGLCDPNFEPWPQAPKQDQYNWDADLQFSNHMLVWAFGGYMDGSCETWTSGPRDNPPIHYRPLRDSLLHWGREPLWEPSGPDSTPPQGWIDMVEASGVKATLLEVNFLRNPSFFYRWNPYSDPYDDTVRENTAIYIATGLVHFLDNRIYEPR